MSATQPRIQIGKVIRNAVVFNLKNGFLHTMNTESLSQSIEKLFHILGEHKVDYVLVGGVALLTYIEGRNTEDIDLIIATSALDRLPEIQLSSRELYFAQGQFEGVKVDFLLTDNPLFEKVSRLHITVQHFQEQAIPTATVEGLLLLKLYALPSLYRQGNFARVGLYENDIATLLHDYPLEIHPLMQELSTYLSASDLQELNGILAEIKQRIERFRHNST